MASSSSTFPLFGDLPPELRTQIWREALPDNDKPAMFPYKEGCWNPRWLLESDPEYDPRCEHNVNLEFRHDLLDHVEVDVPLIFVNSEARAIALSWVRDQGLRMQFREDRRCHVPTRPFDPASDVLYVAEDRYFTFCVKQPDRMFEPDLLDVNVSTGTDVTQMAAPEDCLRHDAAGVFDDFEMASFYCVRVLFVVVNPQPNLEDGDIKGGRRWELESSEGNSFVWNHERGGFRSKGGRYIVDEALHMKMADATRALSHNVHREYVRRLEIRLARVART